MLGYTDDPVHFPAPTEEVDVPSAEPVPVGVPALPGVRRSASLLAQLTSSLTDHAAVPSLLEALVTGIADGAVDTEAGWRRCMQILAVLHPRVDVRMHLARTAPVSVLLDLVADSDVRVRLSILSNPAVVDHRVQRRLASDPDPRVVVGLLGRIAPSRETSVAIVTGPHVEARRVLANMRLNHEVYRMLAEDDDLVTRMIARRALGPRLESARPPLALDAVRGSVDDPATTAVAVAVPGPGAEAEVDQEPAESEPREMTPFQAGLYERRAGLSREEAEPWWRAGVLSGDVAEAIAAGRSPEEQAERRAQAERDRLACRSLSIREFAADHDGFEPAGEWIEPQQDLAS